MALTFLRPVKLPWGKVSEFPTVWHQLGIIFAVAIFARMNCFGDPNYHVDETFYFLVGKAMHAGMVPYVDIWDRKPPGLFVLFWALAAISGSVLSFQIAALLFVTLTGLTVTRIALRWSDPVAAVIAGSFYVAYLQPLLGGGAQAPVFYNLFIVLGLLLLVRAAEQQGARSTLPSAVGAGALAGLAVAVKPTALFEGAFLVLAFFVLEWHRTRRMGPALLVLITAGSVAALPTLSSFAWYFKTGELASVWQATVTSNFQKEHAPAWLFRHTATFLLVVMVPIFSCSIFGWSAARRDPENQLLFQIISLWFIAALAGFTAVPNYYSHYALPLVPVLAVLCARYFTIRPLGPTLGIFFIVWALLIGQSFDFSRGLRSKAQFERAAGIIRANLNGGKLYVFDGPPYLYTATGARWTGPFIFPEHLSNAIERNALGVDATAEITRVLDAAPAVVTMTTSPKPTINRANFKVLEERLTSSYHFVCAVPMFDYEHHYQVLVFARSAAPDRRQCATDSL